MPIAGRGYSPWSLLDCPSGPPSRPPLALLKKGMLTATPLPDGLSPNPGPASPGPRLPTAVLGALRLSPVVHPDFRVRENLPKARQPPKSSLAAWHRRGDAIRPLACFPPAVPGALGAVPHGLSIKGRATR